MTPSASVTVLHAIVAAQFALLILTPPGDLARWRRGRNHRSRGNAASRREEF
jgi:hypothetical protein